RRGGGGCAVRGAGARGGARARTPRGGPAAAGGGAPRLSPRFRARTAGFYDDEDLALAAAVALAGAPPALREIGQVVLFLPTRLSPGELQLADALRDAGRLRAPVGLTGDALAHEPAQALAAAPTRGTP